MSQKPMVIIESPFAAAEGRTIEDHIAYARLAVRDSIRRGEVPFAPHLLYPQDGILNDLDPDERALGIECGYAWAERADKAVFYVDYGMSPGMTEAADHHAVRGRVVVVRRILEDGDA